MRQKILTGMWHITSESVVTHIRNYTAREVGRKSRSKCKQKVHPQRLWPVIFDSTTQSLDQVQYLWEDGGFVIKANGSKTIRLILEWVWRRDSPSSQQIHGPKIAFPEGWARARVNNFRAKHFDLLGEGVMLFLEPHFQQIEWTNQHQKFYLLNLSQVVQCASQCKKVEQDNDSNRSHKRAQQNCFVFNKTVDVTTYK